MMRHSTQTPPRLDGMASPKLVLMTENGFYLAGFSIFDNTEEVCEPKWHTACEERWLLDKAGIKWWAYADQVSELIESIPNPLGRGLDDLNAGRVVACLNACHGYSTEQLTSLAGGNVKREVTRFADKLSEAEGRYMKAESQRDNLLEALKALLEHEGTTDMTGIGEMDSEALQEARAQAQKAINEVSR